LINKEETQRGKGGQLKESSTRAQKSGRKKEENILEALTLPEGANSLGTNARPEERQEEIENSQGCNKKEKPEV